MRKIKCIFLVAVGSFLWASCNSKTADKETEVSKVTTEVSAIKTEISEEDYKEGKWLDKLSAKTPITFTELEELLPKSLLGKPLVKVIDDTKNGRSAIRGQYSLDKEPTIESEVITFYIMDGAGDAGQKGLKSVFSMLKFPTNEDDGIKILKITDWENKRLLVRQRQLKEKWQSELEFIKNFRFHFKIHGKNLKLEEIREAANVLEQLNFPN